MNTTAANDNARRPVTMVSVATLVTFARGPVLVDLSGFGVTVAKLTAKSGQTQGFALSHNGAQIAVLGPRATYDHLEGACATYRAAH